MDSQCYDLDMDIKDEDEEEHPQEHKQEQAAVEDENDNTSPLWSIEDDSLFYPQGLINHTNSDAGSSGKSVFITWNEYYLLNYRFKKTKGSRNVKMTKVRIPLPRNGDSHLVSIHMLEYNSILLMSDGLIYCFESIKSLHPIKWLSGVRCFSKTGQGFSVIREQDQRLFLQIYRDLPSLSKTGSTLEHSYDITYDGQNIFRCEWKTDDYNLMSVKILEEHEKFMQCLFGGDLKKGDDFHIFSISGHIFVLLPTEVVRQDDESPSGGDYNIELLCVYVSSISFIRLLPERNLCLIFLSSGAIDIWYVSQLLQIKQRQMYHLGSEWFDCDADSSFGDFYYTDGQQLVRLRFNYNAQIDEFDIQKWAKPIPGMQSCTWVDAISQLVCLSDNNIFYRISFSLQEEERESQLNGNSSHLMSDLTPLLIEQLRRNAQLMEQYEQEPARLQKLIQGELEKQQLIAVATNSHIYSQEIEAHLEYHRNVPLFSGETLLLQSSPNDCQLQSSRIYAIIKLNLNCRQLIHSNHWQLLVYYDNHVNNHIIPTELILRMQCRVVIPLRKLHNQLLPKFTLKLVAFLELNKQITSVLLPIRIEESCLTYSLLFSGQLLALDLRPELTLSQLIKKKPTVATISQEMSLKEGCSLSDISKLLNAENKIEDNTLVIYFVDSKIILTHTNNHLTLESEDASAIYYIKEQLASSDKTEWITKDSSKTTEIMKLQCQTERLYGTLSDNGMDIESNVRMRLEALQTQYKAIRNTIY
ncbi:uncharacterized protein LOC6641684 [Drosophila willistoni]|uniref:uncharacterized protein LOC6641684 n=1 Tax=Drosophila willistoni TaxID=7260 RepID=UPI00017D706E|nr:uncharacterized protein LOC6641684 [Drosophila willistoni]